MQASIQKTGCRRFYIAKNEKCLGRSLATEEQERKWIVDHQIGFCDRKFVPRNQNCHFSVAILNLLVTISISL